MSLQEFRDNRAQAKRSAILSAATRLFAGLGCNAVSMASLAREAGVSTATLYRHFADKEALFGEVVDALILNTLAELPATPGEIEPAARLRSVALRYATLLADPTVLGLLRAVVAERDNSSGFRARLSEHGNAFFAHEFEHAIAVLFQPTGADSQPDQQLNVQQASAELRGMLEHFTLVGGLLFNEVPDADNLTRLVDRTLASWHQRWR